jgi:NitT/TauT family transport system substrate-binding protein
VSKFLGIATLIILGLSACAPAVAPTRALTPVTVQLLWTHNASTAPVFHAMMARVGIRPDQYTEVNLPSDVAVFASGQAPVWSVYVNNLAVAVQQAGDKLNFIPTTMAYFYADTIFTGDELLARNPDLVRRFLRATLKGWTYAVENPAAIGAIVQKYKLDTDRELESAKITASLPLVNTGQDHIGWMKPEVWAGMEKTLREQGVLTKTVRGRTFTPFSF